MPLKTVNFDMDGVIVDTEPLHRKNIPNFQRFKHQSFRRILYFSYRNIYQKIYSDD